MSSTTTALQHAATLSPRLEASSTDLPDFERLLLEHQHDAYSLALRFLRSHEAAEDVAQDALFRAYRARDRFRGGNLRAWVLRITANAAVDELRRSKRWRHHSLDKSQAANGRPATIDVADPSPPAESIVVNGELRTHLERALGQLPPHLRMVVLLSDVHGMSYEEVAAAVGAPLGTVKSRLSRARARLRDLLFESGVLPSPTTRSRTPTGSHRVPMAVVPGARHA